MYIENENRAISFVVEIIRFEFYNPLRLDIK